MDEKELIKMAIETSKNAYCKYSNFYVGAALLDENENVFTGCNIENFGIQSICAERTAFVKALSEGKRKFKKIAIVGKSLNSNYEFTLPCGYCLQFMAEFCSEDFEIITYEEKSDKIKKCTLKELLPYSFKI